MGKQKPTFARQTSRTTQGLPKTPSGVVGLDEILPGGFPEGRTTLVSGGPGTGKTMPGLEFLYRSALAGQAGIFLLFEERAEAVRRNAILSGDFTIAPLLAIIQGQARKIGARQIVIDAISACQRMGMEKAAFDYLMRRVDRCKRDGITCLMTNQLEGLQQEADFSGIGFSSLLDTILLLRYIEVGREITRRLQVLKSRGSKHSNRYHHYAITDAGIQIKLMPGAPKGPSTPSRSSEAGRTTRTVSQE